jgi:uncharacterized protein (DUF58 family)
MNKVAQSDTLAELQGLALAARRIGGGILEESPPRLPVGGTELSGYRDYSPGDDHRHVDWNVCARHDELRVRLFAGRPDSHVRVLLDCSASMGLGSPISRFDAARRIAAAIGYVAIDRQARLSVFAFSDRLQQRIGPLRGKTRVGQLLNGLETLPCPQDETDFHRVAQALVRLDQTAGPVVVISDLCEPQKFEAGLNVLRVASRSPRVVHLVDPAEDDAISPGDIELVDAESGDRWQVTLTESQLRRYLELAADDRERPRRHCEKYQIPYVRTGIAIPDTRTLGNIIAMRTATL